jgi:hypothetical protein
VDASATPGVEPRAATSLLADLERLRRSVRSDLHTGSVPLLTLGLMALGGGVVAAATGSTWSGGQSGAAFLVRPVYWAVATPVGPLVAMLWFRAVRRRAGLGFDARWLVALIVIAVVVALVGVVLPVGPALAGLAFLVLAVHEESPSAAVGALLLAVVVGIEELTRFFSFSLVSNRFPGTSAASFADDYGSAVAYAVLGIALLGAGLLALRHENAGERAS